MEKGNLDRGQNRMEVASAHKDGSLCVRLVGGWACLLEWCHHDVLNHDLIFFNRCHLILEAEGNIVINLEFRIDICECSDYKSKRKESDIVLGSPLVHCYHDFLLIKCFLLSTSCILECAFCFL